MYHVEKYQLLIAVLVIAMLNNPYVEAMTYWTARQNDRASLQTLFVMKDVYDCIHLETHGSHSPMRDIKIRFNNCIRDRTLHCLQTPKKNKAYKRKQLSVFDRHKYCGLITTVSKISRLPWTVINFTAPDGYLMFFNVLLFRFLWSERGCNDHGLIINVSFRKVPLCFSGRRLPWVLIFKANYASVRFSNDLSFIITMFYSIHKRNWLSDFAEEINLYLKMARIYNVPFREKNIHSPTEVYNFYIRVYHMKQILLFQLGNDTPIDASFHDGPGLLSKRLEYRKDSSFLTSAFLGFLQIRPYQSDVFTLSVQSYDRRNKVPTCIKQYLSKSIQIFSNSAKNKGDLCFDSILSLDMSVKFYILYFTFQGPTSFDSLYDCQYGGLFLEIVSGKTISICEKREDYLIYGATETIRLLLVYYEGYSHGVLIARLLVDNCTAQYLSAGDNLEHYEIVQPSISSTCKRIICSPRNNASNHCRIQITNEDEPIGLSGMQVVKFSSLRRCRGGHTGAAPQYNISALTSPNWPITEYRIINIAKNHSEYILFRFLKFVNISLPSNCDRQRPFSQFGVFFMKTRCLVNPITYLKQFTYVLHSLQVSEECIGKDLEVASLDKPTHFLYPATFGEKNTGLEVNAQYHNCPSKCRIYKYELVVFKKHQNAVHRYTSPVGSAMFTGYINEGVRLKVIPPYNPCTITGCTIFVYFNAPRFPVGVSDGAVGFRIFTTRYILYMIL